MSTYTPTDTSKDLQHLPLHENDEAFYTLPLQRTNPNRYYQANTLYRSPDDMAWFVFPNLGFVSLVEQRLNRSILNTSVPREAMSRSWDSFQHLTKFDSDHSRGLTAVDWFFYRCLYITRYAADFQFLTNNRSTSLPVSNKNVLSSRANVQIAWPGATVLSLGEVRRWNYFGDQADTPNSLRLNARSQQFAWKVMVTNTKVPPKSIEWAQVLGSGQMAEATESADLEPRIGWIFFSDYGRRYSFNNHQTNTKVYL